MLKIENLKASIGDVEILKGIDLEISSGELHAVMGPNGSGKSTLCHVLMGNTDYEKEGKVTLNGDDVLSIPQFESCLLYTSPSPRDATTSRMPSSA